MTEFTDSLFRLKNGQKELIEVKVYEIEDKIVKSRHHWRYKNGNLEYSYLQHCGPCGNIVETKQVVKQDSVKYLSYITRDKHGYETKSKTIAKNQARITTTENEYENNRLVKAVTYTDDGTTLVTKTYKFDDRGNLVEEIEKWAILGTTKHEMKYNENNQLIETIYHKQGEKSYTRYYYEDTLRVKMTTDDLFGKDTIVFEYDENNKLVDKRLSDFDQNGNWQTHKYTDNDGVVKTITTRTFAYR